jgi:transcriptional regulator with XRE-family HTH domain
MDMHKLVGRNVKRIRLEKALTQEQLAALSGSASSTWAASKPDVATRRC